MPFLILSFLFAMLAVMLSDLCHSCLAMLGKAVADISSDSDGAIDLPEDIYIKAALPPLHTDQAGKHASRSSH